MKWKGILEERGWMDGREGGSWRFLGTIDSIVLLFPFVLLRSGVMANMGWVGFQTF